MTRNRVLLPNEWWLPVVVAALAVLPALHAPVAAQQAGPRVSAKAVADDVQTMFVQGFDATKVYLIHGAGANITAQIGDDGVLLVDTGTGQATDKVLAAIRRLTDKPVRYIINTNADVDHAGGNESVLKAIGGQRTAQGGGGGGVENPDGAMLVAHQNTANRMADAADNRPAYPDEVIPKSTFITDNKQIYFNGEPIELWWHGGHTDGDTLVFFRRSDVIVAGDILNTDTFPIVDLQAGGSLQGVLNGLNHIVDLSVPRFNQIDGTRIIPGHGYVCNQSDVAEIRDMTTIMRDRIQYMIQKNMTLAQVEAARPAVDYSSVYGVASGNGTADHFIETLYADLKKPRKGPAPLSGLNFGDGGK